MNSGIVIQLLDPVAGHSLQTWSFESSTHLTIGRSGECDVVLTDPYVSRSHAYLSYDENGWKLIAISERRLVSEGKSQAEFLVSEGFVCRLGSHGCFLRFGFKQERPSRQTIEFDEGFVAELALDREKMAREVDQIAGGEYFQNLKLAARKLRSERQGEVTRLYPAQEHKPKAEES